MMYLSIMVYNIAILFFTAYMVIHVHPIWAVCILLIQRIGVRVVRVPIKEDTNDDAVDGSIDDVYGMDWNEEDDRNESSRDKF